MSETKIIITPKARVGELLDAFPFLEKVLLEMSPAFEKLKNPILRKTVARVATLQQIAVVGGLNVDELVNRLREEAGQSAVEASGQDALYMSSVQPGWFSKDKIADSFDASPVISSGGSPMNEILQRTKLLKPGDIFELKTPFIPAPVLDMLREKGFIIYCIQIQNTVISYITR
jgi:hypothetical protein